MIREELTKNARCPCGSGKKYGKCCQSTQPINFLPQKSLITQALEQAFRPGVPPKVLKKVQELHERRRMIEHVTKIFRQREERECEFVDQYGHARPPVSVKLGEKTMVAIGGSIYQQTREGDYTFLHAIHDHALNMFGEPMLDAEEKKPLNERHPALQWMEAYVVHHNKVTAEQNPDPRAYQIGAGAAWFRFAYDLYTIQDTANLQTVLKKRLLNPDTFQSARHELRVAALSVAAGFELNFENESDNSTTHPEFVGIDRFSNARIAVEAKSRRRNGAYGFASGKDIKPGTVVDVRQLILDSYKKKTDLPFYVFVDANLPAGDMEAYSRWQVEIDQTMADLEKEGYAASASANTVFFINDPSHYLRDEHIGNQGDSLWIKPFVAAHPAVPHPEPDVLQRFMKAWRQRVAPPRDFPNFDSPMD